MKNILVLLSMLLTACMSYPAAARTVNLDAERAQEKEIVLKVKASRTVFFSDVVTMKQVEQFKKDMIKVYAANKKKEIFIIINSPGGYVSDGLSVINMMNSMKKTATLTCIIDNKAYSMAALVFSNCTKLYMTSGSDVLFHEAYTNSNFKGTPNNLYRMSMSLAMLNMKLGAIVAKNLGMDYQDYMKLIIDTEWVLNEEEAYRVGLSDGTVEIDYN